MKINESKMIKKKLLGSWQRIKKKPKNMKVTMIPIVVGVLGTVPKSLERRLEELKIKRRIETIQTTALLRLNRILRRVLET